MAKENVTRLPQSEEVFTPQRSAVVAQPHSYDVPSGHGGEMDALINGLSTFNAGLNKYLDKKSELDLEEGQTARASGATQDPTKSEWWQHGYMVMDGKVKGLSDAASMHSAYDTTFDKDGGDVEKFILDQWQGHTKGLNDKSFLKGYAEAFGDSANKLRTKQSEYQRLMVLQKHDANAQFIVQDFLEGQTKTGGVVDNVQLDSLKQKLRAENGVAYGRFNEILFNAAKGIGDNGNPTVYEALKKDNLDGTKGMYFVPKWKEQIDAAQIHAQNVALTKANQAYELQKKMREDKQDAALYSVFTKLYDGDQQGAQTDFDSLQRAGIFGRASDLIKWTEMFGKVQNRELRGNEEATMTEALADVVKGEMGVNGILDLDLPPKAKRQLLAEWRTVQSAERQAEASGATKENVPFRDHRFHEQEDYVEKQLAPIQDPLGQFNGKNEFINARRATAKLELAEWVRKNGLGDGEALRKKSTEIVERHQKAIDAMQGNMIDRAAKQLRYATPAEAKAAWDAGDMTKQDYAMHIFYFESKPKGTPSGK